MQWLQALKKMHKAHSQICQSQQSIWSLDKVSGLGVVVCVIVEFENAETLLISEVQMLLEHRYDVQ